MTAAIQFPPEFVEQLAQRIAQLSGEHRASVAATGSPWMSAQEAADYLRCGVDRIRKLTMLGELLCHRDGRRVLYHRDDLDRYIRAGGAYAS